MIFPCPARAHSVPALGNEVVQTLKAPSLRLRDWDQCHSYLALRRKGDQKELAMAMDTS